jgi:hypothetical protein
MKYIHASWYSCITSCMEVKKIQLKIIYAINLAIICGCTQISSRSSRSSQKKRWCIDVCRSVSASLRKTDCESISTSMPNFIISVQSGRGNRITTEWCSYSITITETMSCVQVVPRVITDTYDEFYIIAIRFALTVSKSPTCICWCRLVLDVKGTYRCLGRATSTHSKKNNRQCILPAFWDEDQHLHEIENR